MYTRRLAARNRRREQQDLDKWRSRLSGKHRVTGSLWVLSETSTFASERQVSITVSRGKTRKKSHQWKTSVYPIHCSLLRWIEPRSAAMQSQESVQMFAGKC